MKVLNRFALLVLLIAVSCVSAPPPPTPLSMLGQIEQALVQQDGIVALSLVIDFERRGFDQTNNVAIHERYLKDKEKALVLGDGAVSNSMVQFINGSFEPGIELTTRVDLINAISDDTAKEICRQLKATGKLSVIKQMAALVRKERSALLLSYLDTRQVPNPNSQGSDPAPASASKLLLPDEIASALGLANQDKQKDLIRYSTKGAITSVVLNGQGTVASWDANLKGGGDGHLKALEDPELLGRVVKLINTASGKSDMTKEKLVGLLTAKDAKPKLTAGPYSITFTLMSSTNLRFQGSSASK